LVLLPISLSRIKRLNKRQVKNLIISGVIGSLIPAFLFAFAQTKLSSSMTGAMNALTPLFVVILGAAFFGAGISRRNGMGLFIALVGVLGLISIGNDGRLVNWADFNGYVFLVLLATFCYGLNLNIVKYWFVELKPVEITAISLLMVLPITLIYLFAGTSFSFKLIHNDQAWLALGYLSLLGVMGTAMALVLFNAMVKVVSPVFASSVTYLIPIVAIGWGVLDGEILTFGHYLGIMTILLGVWIGNR